MLDIFVAQWLEGIILPTFQAPRSLKITQSCHLSIYLPAPITRPWLDLKSSKVEHETLSNDRYKGKREPMKQRS